MIKQSKLPFKTLAPRYPRNYFPIVCLEERYNEVVFLLEFAYLSLVVMLR